MTILDGLRRYALFSARSICVLAVAGCIALSARAQPSQAWVERVELLRSQIKSAGEQHASPALTGKLWLQLAARYQDVMEFPEAQDALAHSLRLLKGTEAQAEYAGAMEGMASTDLATGRPDEAEMWTKNALKIYQTLGDKAHVGEVLDSIALQLLLERKVREGEVEAAEAVAELQSIAKPDPEEMASAYLTHSFALCLLKRCGEALEDANRAQAIVQANFPPECLQMAAVAMIQGFDAWRTGSPEQGKQGMEEALRIARNLKDLPQPSILAAQLSIMRQYEELLKWSHRKPEAKEMETEIGRLDEAHPAACRGCTVSAAALSPGLLLP